MQVARFPRLNSRACSPLIALRRARDSTLCYSWRERAALAILAAKDDERRELLDICDALARSPGRRGAEQVIDEAGRTNEVIYTAHFRVTYWTDHALKEVRIMDVRRF